MTSNSRPDGGKGYQVKMLRTQFDHLALLQAPIRGQNSSKADGIPPLSKNQPILARPLAGSVVSSAVSVDVDSLQRPRNSK